MYFEDSVAALTAKEAVKIELALKALEQQLFEPVEDVKLQPEEVDVSERVSEGVGERDVYKDYVHSAMAGYSAHTEEVTDDEARLWQKQFPYIMVRGEAMLELDPDYEERGSDNEDDMEGTSFHSIPNNQGIATSEVKDSGGDMMAIGGGDDAPELRVCGVALSVGIATDENSGENNNDEGEDNEEVLYSDGQLEETLFVDVRPPDAKCEKSVDDIFTSIEPIQCQQAEVINSLVDVIFPDIVNIALKPLIEKVVQAGRDHNIQYCAEEDQELEHEQEMDTGDDCVFFSDDRFASDCNNDGIPQAGTGNLVIPDGWD